MNNRQISWEIVIAGLTFVGIAIYLLNYSLPSTTSHSDFDGHRHHIPSPPEPPLPSSIVIDLENLESLKNLKNLEKLKNIRNLEIRLKNLDSIISQQEIKQTEQKHLKESINQLEQELQELEKADFKVKLQDRKVYIDRNYDVKKSTWSEVSPGVYVFREPFEAGNISAADLKVDFGNLKIIGTDNSQGELLVRATGGNQESLENDVFIYTSIQPDEASFSITSQSDNSPERIHLETTLTLPTNVSVDASTSGGHITVTELNGTHNFVTAGGHIELADLSGKTTAKTGGGHIACTDLSGEAKLSTAGGHIQVEDGSGNIFAHTAGGNIELSDISGSIDAKTSGGNIVATLQQLKGPLSLITSAGSIALSMPSSTSADLQAKGTSINLAPAFSFEGFKTNGTISGSLNGGGPLIKLSCGYGNVTINDD